MSIFCVDTFESHFDCLSGIHCLISTKCGFESRLPFPRFGSGLKVSRERLLSELRRRCFFNRIFQTINCSQTHCSPEKCNQTDCRFAATNPLSQAQLSQTSFQNRLSQTGRLTKPSNPTADSEYMALSEFESRRLHPTCKWISDSPLRWVFFKTKKSASSPRQI